MMPDFAVDQFRAACHTFPGAVGLGWDKMHPRALARCSDMVLKLFIKLMLLAEALGSWHRWFSFPSRMGQTAYRPLSEYSQDLEAHPSRGCASMDDCQ